MANFEFKLPDIGEGVTEGEIVNWLIQEGDSVREVLSYVQFDHEDLERAVRRDTERAVKRGDMAVGDARSLMRFYEGGLEGYTYLE